MGYLDRIRRLHDTKQQTGRDRKPWIQAWRELAQMTNGLTDDDQCLPSVLAELNRCERAFANDDWAAFQQAVREVEHAMNIPQQEGGR